jgi:hypothetical protein
MRRDPAERFMEKIVYCPSGCWMWTDATSRNKGGYGYFLVDKKLRTAHRWAYEHFIGPIPEGLVCDHICNVPGCVNPYHLRICTSEENCKRSPKYWSNKTHCANGHPLEGDNLVPNKRQRQCRECNNERVRQWRKKKSNQPATL